MDLAEAKLVKSAERRLWLVLEANNLPPSVEDQVCAALEAIKQALCLAESNKQTTTV